MSTKDGKPVLGPMKKDGFLRIAEQLGPKTNFKIINLDIEDSRKDKKK